MDAATTESDLPRRRRVWPVAALVAGAVLLAALKMGLVWHAEATARARIEAAGGGFGLIHGLVTSFLPDAVLDHLPKMLECVTTRVYHVTLPNGFSGFVERTENDVRPAIASLRQFPQLKTLLVNGPAYGDDDLRVLSQLRRLEYLNLAGCQITNTGLEHLRTLTHLEELSLSNTPISDAGLEQIAQLPRLQSLNLDGTQITDAGLVHLRRMTTLTDLQISNTGVTDGAIDELRAVLPDLQVSDD